MVELIGWRHIQFMYLTDRLLSTEQVDAHLVTCYFLDGGLDEIVMRMNCVGSVLVWQANTAGYLEVKGRLYRADSSGWQSALPIKHNGWLDKMYCFQ